ncbi:uncharacterized protein LOC143448664 [Clavelina lepadiformis]|uniref:uncharacterized protein LOC143448664 n=1 Tax=Clavelina lepadiformis TaxID=159417 RepID=UPI00404223A4
MQNATNFSGKVYQNLELTCWQGMVFASDEFNRRYLKAAASSVLCLVSAVVVLSNAWCAVVIFINSKLRKPTWLFKASMSIKDVILCVLTTSFSIMKIYSYSVVSEDVTDSLRSNLSMNPVELVFNVIYITCLVSSFVHMLLISFDRHQVISKPSRYHTGELLPGKVAGILIMSSWTLCFVVGLSVASQSLERAEKSGTLAFAGSLFPFYQIPALQKWLLGGGMGLIYVITASLLCVSLIIDTKRAKIRKERLLSGVGDPEPLRSRNNSVCHFGKAKHVEGHNDSCNNSETDANDFLLTAGGFGQLGMEFSGLRSGLIRCETESDSNLFSSVNYRPSLRRRIRDTWSLYSANICFLCFTLTTAIPFLAIALINLPGSSILNTEKNFNIYAPPTSYCIGITVLEYLILLQGIGYIAIYLIIDDVFRPLYLNPIRKMSFKKESIPHVPRHNSQSQVRKESLKYHRGSTQQHPVYTTGGTQGAK